MGDGLPTEAKKKSPSPSRHAEHTRNSTALPSWTMSTSRFCAKTVPNSISFPVAAVAGYLLGTVPSADIAAKTAERAASTSTAASIDLRDVGTGNPGAANAAHMLGKGWGAAVLVADITKAALASSAGRLVGGPAGATIAATSAVIGHCYPVWTGGKGGKGVAASIGQVLGTFPVYFPLDVVVAAGTAAAPPLKERAFVANSVASTVWVASSYLAWKKGWPTGWDGKAHGSLPIGAAVSSICIASKFLASPIDRDEQGNAVLAERVSLA